MSKHGEEQGLRRAAEYITTSLHRRPRLAELATVAGLSRFHFQRRFRAHFGETPRQMSLRLRIEHAKSLIRQGVPLPEVACRCGFSYHSHFSTSFKRLTGSQPSCWPANRRRRGVPAAGR